MAVLNSDIEPVCECWRAGGYLMLPTMCLTPFLIDAGYGGSEAVEALVDVFVAPVNLLDIPYGACPFCRHGCQQECYAGADIG